MNPSTLIGMISGILIVVLSVYLTAGDSSAFLNLPGLAIVIGGTLAATLLSYPLQEVARVFKTLWLVLRNDKLYAEPDQQELVTVARLLVRGELLEIERELGTIENPFLRTSVQLLIDRTPIEEISEFLEWRIARLRSLELTEAQVYRTMGMFAPAFGMFGTLIGLVNMLQGMGVNDMNSIGTNMALALLTTLYGVALSNLFFKPVAIKFERRTEQRVQLMSMIAEGILLMARGRSPAYIREYLQTFFARFDDELHMKINPNQPSSRS